MSAFPGSPRVLKAGIVLVDPGTAAVRRVIVLQYNPDTLSRTLQMQGTGEGADRSDATRLKAPPVETFKLDAEIDATDQLERPAEHPVATRHGVAPLLSALEAIVYPTSRSLLAADRLADAGALEILPPQAPLALFVWSKDRVVPVRLTDLSIIEEAFDASLNPIRAKVSVSLRVLSVTDLGFDSKGGSLYMVYQRGKERMASLQPPGSLGALGLSGMA
jgi:hypothetical protein